MKYCVWIGRLLIGLMIITSVWADDLPPLRIAVDAFSPPFVIRGANNQLFGFDIDMMENLCRIMQRTCQYKPMNFEAILPSVMNHQADLGVSSITITLDRAKLVDFSVPYLLSYAQYVGLKKWASTPFSSETLSHKTIGVEAGSVFEKMIQETAPSAMVRQYPNHSTLIQAVQEQEVDFALIDSAAAHYWQTESAWAIVALGEPVLYGYGVGIAVNKDNPTLLATINSALLTYQSNGGFQKTYNAYLLKF